MTHTDFADAVVHQLQADGYAVHQGAPDDGPDLAGCYWFSWSVQGMADAEVGTTVDTELAAWSAALQHRLANSAIGLHAAAGGARRGMAHFYSAKLPAAALDPVRMAARFQIPLPAAQAQVDAMRRQTIFMNDVYQVNVGLVEAPFGPACGDMAWLSIKRRDRSAVHDWREFQEIKNRIVGAEHEGFEVYPAESRLVDTANQFHLWVFLDPKVRLPVGFRTRQVASEQEAAAVGATQREFAPSAA